MHEILKILHRNVRQTNLENIQLESADQSNQTFSEPPFKYRDGPHPLISDSLFSLIIFIYVSVTFLYIFYAFCWRTEVHKPMPDGRDLPMITEMLDTVQQKDSNGKEEA